MGGTAFTGGMDGAAAGLGGQPLPGGGATPITAMVITAAITAMAVTAPIMIYPIGTDPWKSGTPEANPRLTRKVHKRIAQCRPDSITLHVAYSMCHGPMPFPPMSGTKTIASAISRASSGSHKPPARRLFDKEKIYAF
jgi:hypothetical protein